VLRGHEVVTGVREVSYGLPISVTHTGARSAVDLGEEPLLAPQLRQDGGEPGLDARPPLLVEVVVAGWLGLFEFANQVLLPLLQVCDLRPQCRCLRGQLAVGWWRVG
jgi:hypothetical protein